MLVLIRRIGESLMIGDTAKVTIVKVRGFQVSIGLEAPTHVKVHRQEIYSRIQAGEVFIRKHQRQDAP